MTCWRSSEGVHFVQILTAQAIRQIFSSDTNNIQLALSIDISRIVAMSFDVVHTQYIGTYIV